MSRGMKGVVLSDRLVRCGLLCVVFLGVLMLTPGLAKAVVIAETEPNNITGNASPINPGEAGYGNVNPANDSDVWARVDGLAGHLIFAFVDTQDSAAGSDSNLNLLDDLVGFIEGDDSDGPGAGSLIAGAEVPITGSVYFDVTEDGANDVILPYILYQALIDPADSAAETEGPSADPISARIMTGQVSGADLDLFSFEATAGDVIVVIMDDDPDNNGILTDTELDLLDTDATTVLAAGDDNAGFDGNGAGAAVAPSTGTYFVRVGDGGGAADTDYAFTVLVNDEPVCLDADGDGICDSLDLCDGNDATGDSDGDGICNDVDACEGDDASGDSDGDGVCDDVDACDGDDASGDLDGDGICDDVDNCPAESNPGQEDADADGVGDACTGTAPGTAPAGDCGTGLCAGGAAPLMPLMLLGMGLARHRNRWGRRRAVRAQRG